MITKDLYTYRRFAFARIKGFVIIEPNSAQPRDLG